MNLLRAVSRFTKIEHTLFSLPLVFAGAYLGAGRHVPEIHTLALIIMAATGGRVLGMSMNRIFDRKMDAMNDRTKQRELPAGTMSLGKAWLIAAIGLIVYLFSCALMGWHILALSPVPAFFLTVYSLLKRFTCLCHYGIGLVLGMAPLAAYVAVQGRPSIAPDIFLLSGFVFFWMSGYDIIYAMQDQEFDHEHGVHSIPGRFGVKVAERVAFASHAAAMFLLIAFAACCSTGRWAWVAVGCCAVTFCLSYMSRIPLPLRFFPLSAIASIVGSLVVYL
jgi:4-hydroxybenzoate polyprenyltransferase